jgi:SAM-dependent methyltransferase
LSKRYFYKKREDFYQKISPGCTKIFLRDGNRGEIMGKDFIYNGQVACWWHTRATDGAHARAYRKISEFIRDSYRDEPRVIVDYACGSGKLLFLLSRRFAGSKLVGLDGSSFLLNLARRRKNIMPRACSGRIEFIETRLPDMNLMRGQADLVIFCFPNMNFYPGTELLLNENDRKIARRMALNEDRKPTRASAIQSALEQGRAISLNLRRLLVRGGICVRVEYATIQRHELSPGELELVSFEEGSLDSKVNGMTPELWFRVMASSYFRSQVLEDVYEQTADERDKNGGYLITVLKAL